MQYSQHLVKVITVGGSVSETHLGSDLFLLSVLTSFCIPNTQVNFVFYVMNQDFTSSSRAPVVVAPGNGCDTALVTCCCFLYTSNMAMTCLHLPPLLVPMGQEQLEPTITPAHSRPIGIYMLTIKQQYHLNWTPYNLICKDLYLFHDLTRFKPHIVITKI